MSKPFNHLGMISKPVRDLDLAKDFQTFQALLQADPRELRGAASPQNRTGTHPYFPLRKGTRRLADIEFLYVKELSVEFLFIELT